MAIFNYFNPFEVLRNTLNSILPGLGDDVLDFFSGMFDGIYLVFIQPLVSAWELISGFFGNDIDTTGLDKASQHRGKKSEFEY